MPIGKFQMFCSITNSTHMAPVINPNTSTMPSGRIFVHAPVTKLIDANIRNPQVNLHKKSFTPLYFTASDQPAGAFGSHR